MLEGKSYYNVYVLLSMRFSSTGNLFRACMYSLAIVQRYVETYQILFNGHFICIFIVNAHVPSNADWKLFVSCFAVDGEYRIDLTWNENRWRYSYRKVSNHVNKFDVNWSSLG